MTIQTRRTAGGPFAIPALLAAIVTGFGIGFGRRAYRPRDPEPAAPPEPAKAEPGPKGDVACVPAAFDAGAAAEANSGPDADPTPVTAPAPDAAGAGDGVPRKAPTPLGARVIAALQGRGPMRKAEIAALVQVGRGSGVRIVDRLVDDGWLSHRGDGLYAVA